MVKKAPQDYALKQIVLKDLEGDEHKEALESAKKEYNLLKKNLLIASGLYIDHSELISTHTF